MATSVHIPPDLLEAVDRKARVLQVSRNRFIISALEHELSRETDWSPGFFEQLSPLDPQTAAVVDDMVSAIRKGRNSKRRPSL